VKPIILLPSGEADADFVHAAGFPVETALYIRYADGDDVLVTSAMEYDRARAQSRAARVLESEAAEASRLGQTLYREGPSREVLTLYQVGQVISVHFAEGQEVAAGTLLFEIDQLPFRTEMNRAEANLARDSAQLQQADANLARDIAQAKNAAVTNLPQSRNK